MRGGDDRVDLEHAVALRRRRLDERTDLLEQPNPAPDVRFRGRGEHAVGSERRPTAAPSVSHAARPRDYGGRVASEVPRPHPRSPNRRHPATAAPSRRTALLLAAEQTSHEPQGGTKASRSARRSERDGMFETPRTRRFAPHEPTRRVAPVRGALRLARRRRRAPRRSACDDRGRILAERVLPARACPREPWSGPERSPRPPRHPPARQRPAARGRSRAGLRPAARP